mgnify:CR=1 FL=1
MVKESKTLQPLLTSVFYPNSVYAKQFVYKKNNESKLSYKYIAGTEEEIWKEYIKKGDLTICEVINSKQPCHLYIDIDVNLKETPGIKVYECWEAVKPIISNHFKIIFPNTPIDYIVMDSSSNKKGSLHIVIKIKDHLFTNASHCGAYMRVLKKFIENEHSNIEGAFSFFDLGIYTRNRLFRMLGQTKAGQKRYLRSHLDFTFENWRNSKVCPILTTNVELIEMKEPDGGIPIYTSGSRYGAGQCTIVSGWVPSCVKGDIYQYLCEEVGIIQRMVFTGENMKVVCNTSNRDCVLQKRKHKSNVMYIVIDLINKSYHIKCHSRHCRKRRSKTFYFDKRLSNIIENWMNTNVTSNIV